MGRSWPSPGLLTSCRPVSFTSAFGNVFLGRSLDFAVTPKEKRADTGPRWDLVRPQLVAMGLLVVALVIGAVRLALGEASPFGTIFNMVWVVYDLVIFSVIIRAVHYRGFEPEVEPAFARTSDEGAA